jgi:alkaline phosphatase D
MPTTLAVLLCGVVTACAAASTPPPEPAPDCGDDPRLIGPRVGAVTEDSAKIWVRTCSAQAVAVEFKPAAAGWGGDETRQRKATTDDEGADSTAVILLDGLEPDTAYDYRVGLPGDPLTPPAGGRFRTLAPAGTPARFSFIVSSDMHHPQVFPEEILTTMAQQDAAFALLLGDQLAIEWVVRNIGRLGPRFQSDYELGYRDAWTYPPFARLLANMSTIMTWDDHEIVDNWDSGVAREPYPAARAAFEEFVASANPTPRAPESLYFSFRAGDVDFYVLDTRSFRSTGEMPDGPQKTMLGDEQKEDLKRWLRSSDARFKFIASSVMWNDDSAHAILGESWPAYRTERNEILSFIRDQGIGGVVLLSGDEHWGGVFRLMPWGVLEVAPGPMGWPQLGPLLRTPPLYVSRWVETFGLFTADTTVCPARLTVQLLDKAGETRYSLELTEDELGASPSC